MKKSKEGWWFGHYRGCKVWGFFVPPIHWQGFHHKMPCFRDLEVELTSDSTQMAHWQPFSCPKPEERSEWHGGGLLRTMWTMSGGQGEMDAQEASSISNMHGLQGQPTGGQRSLSVGNAGDTVGEEQVSFWVPGFWTFPFGQSNGLASAPGNCKSAQMLVWLSGWKILRVKNQIRIITLRVSGIVFI